MIKPTLLVRLLKERLKHNEAYVTPGHNTQMESLRLSHQNRIVNHDTVLGYEIAVKEEIEFLRAILKEIAP